MADYRASQIDWLDMLVGATVTLESLRQAVVPPYVMVVPFIEPPPNIQVTSQTTPDEEGVHVAVFELRATAAGDDTLRVGFRDLRTRDVVIEKRIAVHVR